MRLLWQGQAALGLDHHIGSPSSIKIIVGTEIEVWSSLARQKETCIVGGMNPFCIPGVKWDIFKDRDSWIVGEVVAAIKHF